MDDEGDATSLPSARGAERRKLVGIVPQHSPNPSQVNYVAYFKRHSELGGPKSQTVHYQTLSEIDRDFGHMLQ